MDFRQKISEIKKLIDQKNFEQALQNATKLQNLIKEQQPNDLRKLSDITYIIGLIYYEKGETSKAEQYFNTAAQLEENFKKSSVADSKNKKQKNNFVKILKYSVIFTIIFWILIVIIGFLVQGKYDLKLLNAKKQFLTADYIIKNFNKIDKPIWANLKGYIRADYIVKYENLYRNRLIFYLYPITNESGNIDTIFAVIECFYPEEFNLPPKTDKEITLLFPFELNGYLIPEKSSVVKNQFYSYQHSYYVYKSSEQRIKVHFPDKKILVFKPTNRSPKENLIADFKGVIFVLPILFVIMLITFSIFIGLSNRKIRK